MKLFPTIHAKRFANDEKGAAIVEFAILLPMLLLVFAVIVGGGRMMWSYQSASAGVRDAARYLARVAPSNICSAGLDISSYSSKLETIVSESLEGDSVLPSGISVTSVSSSLSCISGTYSVSPAPIATVTANLEITFPFSGIFELIGSSRGTIVATISDQSRIYGT